MNNGTMIRFCAAALLICGIYVNASAQSTMSKEQEEAYIKTINKRADKIVDGLGITDSSKYKKVSNIVAGQYVALNNIYIGRDAEKKNIKEKDADNKDAAKTKLATLEEEVNAKVDKQHQEYLTRLGKVLTVEQIDKVKDGMTYNVRNVTYRAYTQMLPDLSEPQKKQIMDWLVEAREHSMDAESSEKKHAWFGKYKGRINNYLSKSGIDMKKAESDWQQRLKESQQPKNN